MTVNIDDIIQLLSSLADEKQLKVSLKETIKGGFITGAAATIGGLALGPPGLALGGALGGAYAAYSSSGKFKSVAIILLEMEEHKKKLLYTKAMAILGNIGPQDIVAVTAFVAGNPAIKQQLLGAVVDHVNNQLRMEIID